MIENATNARMQHAFDRAHKERAEAFVNVFGWLFRKRQVPLDQSVLTEPSRCA